MFQPFSRLRLEASDIQGTGIGLTVTKQLVEMMDGSIVVDSAAGRGTTFWVEFPVKADAEVKKTAKRPLKPDVFSKATATPCFTWRTIPLT